MRIYDPPVISFKRKLQRSIGGNVFTQGGRKKELFADFPEKGIYRFAFTFSVCHSMGEEKTKLLIDSADDS